MQQPPNLELEPMQKAVRPFAAERRSPVMLLADVGFAALKVSYLHHQDTVYE
jgi:hypothetical protein